MILEIKLGEATKQMESSAASSAQMLTNALEGMGEKLAKLLERSNVTTNEIAVTTQLVRDSRQTLDALDGKIDRNKTELSSQIEGLKMDTDANAEHLKTLQRQYDEDKRLASQTISDRPVGSQNLPPQPSAETSLRRQNVPPQSPRTSLEAIIHHRRGLIDADVSSPEQPQRQRTFTYPSCDPTGPEETISPGRNSTRDHVDHPPGVDYGHGITLTSRSFRSMEILRTTLGSRLILRGLV